MARGAQIGTTAMPALSANFQVNRNTIAEDAFGIATQASINGGSFSVTGSIAAAYRPAALAPIVNLVLGDDTGTINLSGSFTTTTISIADDYGNTTTFAAGCVVNSLELSMQSDDYARITFNFIGTSKKAISDAIGSSSLYYTEELAIFYNAMITLDPGTGADPVYAKSITLRIERPTAPDNILGSEYATTVNQSGNLTVSGNIGLAANEYDQLTNALNTDDDASDQPASDNKNLLSGGILKIDLHRPDGSDYQEITVDNIKITTGSQSGESRQAMTKSVDFVAEINNSYNVVFGAVSPRT